jgi:hypothetical protein
MSSNPLSQRFHHTGFVVASIADVIESFCRSVDGGNFSQTWHDPVQRVRVAFIYPRRSTDPSIELVEPADPGSPVEKFLERGGGLHHVCYEVEGLDEAVRRRVCARACHRSASPARCSFRWAAHRLVSQPREAAD